MILKYLFALISVVMLLGCNERPEKCEPYNPGAGYHCNSRHVMNQYGVCICPDIEGGGVVK